jgi:hypothetical protein
MPTGTAPPQPAPPEPLTRTELEPLWRRERLVGGLQIAGMVSLLLAGWITHRDATLTWLAHPLLAAALVLVGAGALLQVRVHCPRCRAWLRAKLLRMLPDKCPQCGVVFPPASRGDGSGA